MARGMEREVTSFGEEPVISVRDVTKSFKIFYDKGTELKDRMLFRGRRRFERRQVLDGISFDVKKGEAIGLVGNNGCGKSTTLKLLTRIMYPDTGSVELKGRVSALIELGAGFHLDMSGRENIYTNAAIFGLSRKEVDACIDDIIAFSELEEFIDNPVRTYSSGMYMRLAFSVAINVKADILLIDEILAVGDAAFQAKCFNKLREIKGQGTTIVIVSHSLSQIEQICERSIWIRNGRIEMEGPPRLVHAEYMAWMSEKVDGPREETGKEEDPTQKQNGKRWGSMEAEMTDVRVLDGAGQERDRFSPLEDIRVRIAYSARKKLTDVVLGVAVYRADQTYIYGTNSLLDRMGPITLEGNGTVLLKMNRVGLNAGEYTVDLAFHRPDGFNYDFRREVCRFRITEERGEVGIISLDHEWEISSETGAETHEG